MVHDPYWIFSLKLVHILSMAIWFGTKVLVPADVKRAINDGGIDALIKRVNLVQVVAIAASMVTLASGLGMIFLLGGFDDVHWRIHAGLALTLSIFALGAFGVDKAWKKIKQAAATGAPKEELLRHERRLAILMTAENVVWLAILFLMVFRIEALP